jgi:hypothetical protein
VISSDTTNLDVRNAAIAAGWNQSSFLKVTVNPDVYVYEQYGGSILIAAMSFQGSFPSGVELWNYGIIIGGGGFGGTDGPGYAGSCAVIINSPAQLKIFNYSFIGGGGGGGGAWSIETLVEPNFDGFFVSPGRRLSPGGGGGAGGGPGGSAVYYGYRETKVARGGEGGAVRQQGLPLWQSDRPRATNYVDLFDYTSQPYYALPGGGGARIVLANSFNNGGQGAYHTGDAGYDPYRPYQLLPATGGRQTGGGGGVIFRPGQQAARAGNGGSTRTLVGVTEETTPGVSVGEARGGGGGGYGAAGGSSSLTNSNGTFTNSGGAAGPAIRLVNQSSYIYTRSSSSGFIYGPIATR